MAAHANFVYMIRVLLIRKRRMAAAGVEPTKESPMSNLPSSSAAVGQAAPDFTLHSTPDQSLSLSELRGGPVVLVFYPADWSPVCGDQVSLYNEMLSEFRGYGATILGISVDGAWCHVAFANDRKLKFPLLADFEPKGEIARRYGVYETAEGTSQRALFVIDADGIVRWRYVSPIGINPGADGILDALEKLPRTEGKS
jgi:peroxiredoxin